LKWKNKVGLSIGLILVALIIFGITNSDFQNETNPTRESNKAPQEPNYLKAIKLVQDFRGTDKSGSTVTETIVSIIRIAYGNEPIFDNLSTKFSWDGLRSFETTGNSYDVYVDFKAYDGSKEFHFIVDIDTNTIWAGNELGSVILDIVESES